MRMWKKEKNRRSREMKLEKNGLQQQGDVSSILSLRPESYWRKFN